MGVQAIGMPVRREEDFRLLRGKGRYVDDVKEVNDAHGYVVRSPHAHARIAALDVGRARTASGVLCVLIGEDLARRGLGTLMPAVRRRRRNGASAFVCPQPLLAGDRVRYVGDPVAFIVAETVNQAKDAAELIDIDYQLLPAVVGAEAALAPGVLPAVGASVCASASQVWKGTIGSFTANAMKKPSMIHMAVCGSSDVRSRSAYSNV